MNAKTYIRFSFAICVYALFSAYLYLPYIENFNRYEILIPVNVALASLGCYVLSRRWIGGFLESLLAGAIYGFGPYLLSLGKFHPAASLLAASIPWLFLPAAYAAHGNKRWLSIPAAILPFAAIIVFFRFTTMYRFFAAPLHANLQWKDALGFIAPVTASRLGLNLPGFYHIPLAGLIFGSVMLINARRIGIFIILANATTLVFLDNLNTNLQICPLLWLSITMLCGSIIIGTAIQGIVSTGQPDRLWILYTVIVMAALAIVTLLLATRLFRSILPFDDGYGILLCSDAMMYILGAVALGIIYFISSASLRLHRLRELILISAILIDIFLGARYIVDSIF